MKLDKRACRHASNVPLYISLNAGVLYTDRVKYLVTAAVKLLGGHRVLTVYFPQGGIRHLGDCCYLVPIYRFRKILAALGSGISQLTYRSFNGQA